MGLKISKKQKYIFKCKHKKSEAEIHESLILVQKVIGVFCA